jgi:hypothetical protein
MGRGTILQEHDEAPSFPFNEVIERNKLEGQFLHVLIRFEVFYKPACPTPT